MNNFISIIYKDKDIARFHFLSDINNNKIINKKLRIDKKEYELISVMGEKGACSIILKCGNQIVFSSTIDAYGKKNFGTVLFFKIENNEFLQIEVW